MKKFFYGAVLLLLPLSFSLYAEQEFDDQAFDFSLSHTHRSPEIYTEPEPDPMTLFRSTMQEQGRDVMAGILQQMLESLKPKQQSKPVVQTEPQLAIQEQEPLVMEQVEPDTRALVGPDPDTDKFEVSVARFGGANRYFLGPNEDSKTLSRAVIEFQDDGTTKVVATPLLPTEDPVVVNGEEVESSPILSKKIAHIALAGTDKKPVVVQQDDPETDDRKGASVFLITQDDGSTILTHHNNTDPESAYIKDAQGVTINQQIVALEASRPVAFNDSKIFAAVADGTKVVADIKTTQLAMEVDETKASEITIFSTTGATQVHDSLDPGDAQDAAANIKDHAPTNQAIGEVVFEESNIENDNSEAILLRVIDRAIDDNDDILTEAQDAGHGLTPSELAGGMSKTRMVDAVHKGLNGDAIGVFLADIVAQAQTGDDPTLEGAAGALEGAVSNALVATLTELVMNGDTVVEKDALRTWASDIIKDDMGLALVGDGQTSLVGVDGINRGIAVLTNDSTELEVVDHDTVSADPPLNKAALVDLTAVEDGENDPMVNMAFYNPMDADPITRAMIGSSVCLHWDEPLQRLYVGLSDVSRGADFGQTVEHSGGVCSVLMGKLNEEFQLSLFPVLKNVASDLFPNDEDVENKDHRIIGFYRDSDSTEPLLANVAHLKTMHTSTGKCYLILNGGVDTKKERLGTQLYALPLVKSDEDDKGFLGVFLGDEVSAISMADEMPKSTQLNTKIGLDPQLLSFNCEQPISNVQVVGDTVFVSLVGERDRKHETEAGIFASRALFDASNGMVRAWTPWQRRMGHIDSVQHSAFDATSSRFWFLTTPDGFKTNESGEDQAFDTVKVTEWGRGDTVLHSAGEGESAIQSPLSFVLEPMFDDRGGVFGLFDFSTDTPGFREQQLQAGEGVERERHQQFGMMVATGMGRVAIIEAGKFDDATNNFQPTRVFFDDDEFAAPIRIIDDSDDDLAGQGLKNLGVICAAEVSRLPLSDTQDERGWLFVGGQGGLAVFTNRVDGDGWPTSKTGTRLQGLLDNADEEHFPRGEDWKFLQLLVKDASGNEVNPFIDVRKLVSDQNKYLYVLTGDALYRFTMNDQNLSNPDDINGTKAFLTDLRLIASVADSAMTGMVMLVDEYYDFMLIKRDNTGGTSDLSQNKTILLIGTSQGLFVNDEDTLNDAHTNADVGSVIWSKVQTDLDNDLGPALFFDFISSQRGNRLMPDVGTQQYADGNLNVFAFDVARTGFKIYRFDIQNGSVISFAEPYKTGSTNVDYFVQIGTTNSPVSTLDLNGPIDTYSQERDISFSEVSFPSAVAELPDPNLFINAGQDDSEINLGLEITTPPTVPKFVVDPASGATYVPGEFGVRVNE